MHARVSRLLTQALCKPRELPSVDDAAPYAELWEELCRAALEMGTGSSSKVVTSCLSFLLRVLLPLCAVDGGKTSPLGQQLSSAFLPLLPKIAQGKGNSVCVKQLFVSHGQFALSLLQPTIDAVPEPADVHACAVFVELLLSALRHRDVLMSSSALQAAVAAAAAPLVSSLVPLLQPGDADREWTSLFVQICGLVTALVTAAQKMPVVQAGLASVDVARFSAAGEVLLASARGAAPRIQDNVRGTCAKLKAVVDAAAAAAAAAAAVTEPRKRRRL